MQIECIWPGGYIDLRRTTGRQLTEHVLSHSWTMYCLLRCPSFTAGSVDAIDWVLYMYMHMTGGDET
jgi:hypothetical protein